MTFQERLNTYLTELNCTAKELSAASGVSAAALSRYRTGERIPATDSPEPEKLAEGIAALSNGKWGREAVLEALLSALPAEEDADAFTEKLNALLSALDVNLSRLTRAISYDSSHFYRIRTGKRRPSDPEGLAGSVCRFLAQEHGEAHHRKAAADLLRCAPEELQEDETYENRLRAWLLSGVYRADDGVGKFLTGLDSFDLDAFIQTIHFDQLKVPTVPFRLPSSRNYYGVEEMRQGELDFFKATVLSKAKEPIFMCSDMDMEDLAKDIDFGKKWMFAIAMSIKKGLHIHIIHNLDRPFNEMMLGLESWVPIYMTGQVSPYHLKNVHTEVYHHLNYVSGAAALTGECINGRHGDGRYYLTNNREELAYYRKKANALLEKASPLMEIYRAQEQDKFHAFLDESAVEEGSRRNLFASLPVYTMEQSLLQRILTRNGIEEEAQTPVLRWAEAQRHRIEQTLTVCDVTDEVPELSASDFSKAPMPLSLSDIFFEKELFYSYEEYQGHLAQSRRFAQNHPRYSLHMAAGQAFRNIQIRTLAGKWAIVSKNKTPAIHFVIRHPKLVDAICRFSPPVTEE